MTNAFVQYLELYVLFLCHKSGYNYPCDWQLQLPWVLMRAHTIVCEPVCRIEYTPCMYWFPTVAILSWQLSERTYSTDRCVRILASCHVCNVTLANYRQVYASDNKDSTKSRVPLTPLHYRDYLFSIDRYIEFDVSLNRVFIHSISVITSVRTDLLSLSVRLCWRNIINVPHTGSISIRHSSVTKLFVIPTSRRKRYERLLKLRFYINTSL